MVVVGYCNQQLQIISFDSYENIFPDSWREAPYFCKADKVNEREIGRARRIILKAFSKYPSQIIQESIKKVYIVKNLFIFKNVPVGGTSSKDCIYIAINTGSDEQLERIFHHEFSTLLLNKHFIYFDKKSWSLINPVEFNYLGVNSWDKSKEDGGIKAIRSNRSSQNYGDIANFESGFLNQYSKSSIENDFNEFASVLFMNYSELQEPLKKYRRLSEKRSLVIKFYHEISNEMTEQYFLEISPTFLNLKENLKVHIDSTNYSSLRYLFLTIAISLFILLIYIRSRWSMN